MGDLPLWAWALIVVVALYVGIVLALLITGRRLLAREAATLIPNLLGLFRGLLADPRVPLPAKIVLALGLVWVASPIDLIPEFIPIIGPLDDVIVAAVVLGYVVRTAGRDVVREHWPGDPSVLARLFRIA